MAPPHHPDSTRRSCWSRSVQVCSAAALTGLDRTGERAAASSLASDQSSDDYKTWTKRAILTRRWRRRAGLLKQSTMAIDRLDIVIQGSGPYGFRLAGGDGRPLTVTKVFICVFNEQKSLHRLPQSTVSLSVATRKFHLAAILYWGLNICSFLPVFSLLWCAFSFLLQLRWKNVMLIFEFRVSGTRC